MESSKGFFRGSHNFALLRAPGFQPFFTKIGPDKPPAWAKGLIFPRLGIIWGAPSGLKDWLTSTDLWDRDRALTTSITVSWPAVKKTYENLYRILVWSSGSQVMIFFWEIYIFSVFFSVYCKKWDLHKKISEDLEVKRWVFRSSRLLMWVPFGLFPPPAYSKRRKLDDLRTAWGSSSQHSRHHFRTS